jgi:hypothetical protein
MNGERGMMNGGGRFFYLIVHHSSFNDKSRAGRPDNRQKDITKELCRFQVF